MDIQHGRFSAALTSESGCRTLYFRMALDSGETIDLMRPLTGPETHPNYSANFPLVPYSNRIGGGTFTFQGTVVRVPLNAPGEPHAIHGVGWEVDWEPVTHTDNSVTCRYRHPGDQRWPWAFTSIQTVTLNDAGMVATLSLTNDADHPMPGGLAFHPYFPRSSETKLHTSAQGFLERDDIGLPSHVVSDHPVLSALENGETVPVGVDTGLEGWTGRAEIQWPDRQIALEMEAPGMTRAVLYTPEGKDFFCFEPISHTTNAVNRLPDGLTGDGGVKILPPGETLTLEMRLVPRLL
ncbi:aldose 1-epimerase [Rhodospirillaceae bacterium KN72]|uniref:Aldose 1-epimerase n=1 Tax=Pacificispira spongiicola TaxID=2729598 RepID=A0A7Y0DY18_9PROT|nr:aldose 1-epimerase [Pacificispira spongiicola]NMM43678.1 aldose 1-epimerase [Pacificispira spongiicola]